MAAMQCRKCVESLGPLETNSGSATGSCCLQILEISPNSFDMFNHTFFITEWSLVSCTETVAGGVRVVVDTLSAVDARVVRITLVSTPELHPWLVVQRGLQGHTPREEPHISHTPNKVIRRTF